MMFLVIENIFENFEIIDGSFPISIFPNFATAQHYCDELNIKTIIELFEEDIFWHFIGTNINKNLAYILQGLGYSIIYHENAIHWYIEKSPGPITINKDQANDIRKNLTTLWFDVLAIEDTMRPIYKHHLSR